MIYKKVMTFSLCSKYRNALCALLILSVLGSCSKGSDTEGEMMGAGLDALYTRHDPTEAAAQFRKVLERNPTHYGATFQLAYALDQAGKGEEARPLWEKVLQMAEGYNDKQTADTARARLAAQR